MLPINIKNIRFSNIFFPLWLMLPAISQIVFNIAGLKSGFPILLVGFFLITMILNNEIRIRININIISVILIVFLGFVFGLFSFGFNSVLATYLTSFLINGCILLIFIGSEHESEKIIDNLCIIGFLILFYYTVFGFRQLDLSKDYELFFTLSRVFLPVGLASIYRVFFNRSKKKLITVISIALILMYLVFATTMAARSSLIAIFAFIVIQLTKRSIGYKKKILWISIIISAILIFLNLDQIIYSVFELLQKHGITSWAIEKMYYLMNQEDVTNGRSGLIINAWRYICDHPLGAGISGYEMISSDGGYTHNLFLQIFCDYGLFFGFAICLYIIKVILNIVLKKEYDAYFEIILVSSVVILLFTTTVWDMPIFWLLIYEYILRKKNKTLNTHHVYTN